MWEAEPAAAGDHLRQGDLLEGVIFPITKMPLQSVSLKGEQIVVVQAKVLPGLVISQCCDNDLGDYAVIAQVQRHTGLTDAQLGALSNREPTVDDHAGYVINEFLLDPIHQVLEVPGVHRALLTRTVTVWGPECSQLLPQRKARMTPEGRRWLRLNLLLLWSRVEADDRSILEGKGIPTGFKS